MNPLSFILFSIVIGTCFAAESFYAKNGKIYDATDKEFMIRGINNAHADWDNYNRGYALKALPFIAKTGANTVRIQWRMATSGGLSTSNLENILVECKKNQLAAIVQLHDGTGSPDEGIVQKSAEWFKSNMWLFNKYKKFVIINVVNEWSPFGTDGAKWVRAYTNPIKTIRSAGWNGLILIDGPAYAQDPTVVANFGQQLVKADPKGNVAFSIHAYADWKAKGGRYQPAKHLLDIMSKGLTFILGEFANQHPEHIQGRSDCPWAPIDHGTIMQLAKDKRFGILGWSWAGNGDDCGQSLTPLNLVAGDQKQESTWKSNNYTAWGKILIESANGIKNTSSKNPALFN